MNLKKFFVWVWLDPVTREPRYVGCAAKNGTAMPWDELWDERAPHQSWDALYDENALTAQPRPVCQWLATFGVQPPRDPSISDTAYNHADAVAYAAYVRNSLGNVDLLPFRSYVGTNQGNGGAPKGVFGPNGDVFVSVSAAARDAGVDVGTMSRRLQQPERFGYRYSDDDYQAIRTAPNSCCCLCHSHGSKSELAAGPKWATSAVCRQCRRILTRYERKQELHPDTLNAKADKLIANVSGRRKAKIVSDERPGFPAWLRRVAELLKGGN
jgi:hypothetical protein